jgi:spore coat polysaccharide biosynthesis predicted glycosyltransferase SpsG
LRDELDIHFCTTLLGLENRIEQRGKTREYIGPRYFVFGDGNNVTQPRLNDAAEFFLCTFGGSDPGNITEKFFKIVSEIGGNTLSGGNFTGITGPGFTESRCDHLRADFPEAVWKKNLPDLFSELERSFFVFCAGGITAYEALRCGALPVCIAQHEEQLSVISNLSARNMALCAGKFDNIDRELLENCLLRPYDYRALREKAVLDFYDLCDGFNGPVRIVEIIRESCG